MTTDIGWVDIGFAVFLLVSVVVGLWRGVVFELLSLAGWFAAYFAARVFAPMLQDLVPIGDPGSALNHGATFAGIFLLALVLWSVGARLVRAMIRATPLSPVDRVLGAGFGLLRGLVVLLLVALVVGVSPLSKSVAWQRSQGAVWLTALLQELRPVFANPTSPTLST